MQFTGIGTATPAQRYTKAECLSAFERSAWFGRLDERAHFVARTVLQRDNGIEARRLAVDSLDEVFAIDPDTLALRFRTHAPVLAAEAAAAALARAGCAAADIEAVVVSTPGSLSRYIAALLTSTHTDSTCCAAPLPSSACASCRLGSAAPQPWPTRS